MATFKKIVHDKLNPLHLYCRLRDFGIKKELALALSKWYEKKVHFYITKIPGYKIKVLN